MYLFSIIGFYFRPFDLWVGLNQCINLGLGDVLPVKISIYFDGVSVFYHTQNLSHCS